jgi:ABC-type glycerol-3-phosphate transport system permease component
METSAQISTFAQTVSRPKKPFPVSRILLTGLFIFLGFVFVLPLYWMFISSLKPQSDIFAYGFSLVPSHASLNNYDRLFNTLPFPRWFLNSVLQSAGYAVVSVGVCALGGFALAKYRFPFRNVIFFLILAVQMVPFHLLIVSLFVIIVNLNLVDRYMGAILPLAAHPIGIFFMRQYMLALDDEMLNSARVDGANEYRLFFSIVLPNIRPAVATLLVLFSLEYWNNLLWPLIVFRNADKFPLAVGISTLVNTAYRPVYDLAMAASTLATIPIIILFFLLRRQFMEGITVTGTGVEK